MACKKVRRYLLCCFGSSRKEYTDGEDSYEYVGESSKDYTGAPQVFYRDDQSKNSEPPATKRVLMENETLKVDTSEHSSVTLEEESEDFIIEPPNLFRDDKNDVVPGSYFNLSSWFCGDTWNVLPSLPDRDYPINLQSLDQKSSDHTRPEFKVKWDMEAEWRQLGIDPVGVFGATTCTSDYRQEQELFSDAASLVSDHVKVSIDSGLSRSLSMPTVGSAVMSFSSTTPLEATYPVEGMNNEISGGLRISGGYSPVWKKTVINSAKCWSLAEVPHMEEPKCVTKKRRKSFPIGENDYFCRKLSSTRNMGKIHDVKDYSKSAIKAFKENGTKEASSSVTPAEYVGPDYPLVLPLIPHHRAECEKL